MISPRFAPAFILLVGIALVPTLIHSYIGISSDDGRLTKNISPTLGDFHSEPTDKTAEWAERRFKSRDWIERRYVSASGDPFILFVGRSYDAKRLYHHPELALAYGSDFGKREVLPLANDPDRPVHILRGRREEAEVLVAYALLYDGRFVNDPILFQLKEAWRALFQPRKAMTLIFVSNAVSSSDVPPDVPIEERPALHLLNLAITDFLSQGEGAAG